MKKVYILAALCLLGQSSWAQIREFQTTRLNSTAGAGAASILSTEAAILNPATATFFRDSGFSYQSYSTSLRHKSAQRETDSNDFTKRNNSQGFFMTDHSGPVKGGVSYLSQNENHFKREQMVFHGAAAIGTTTSMGFSYRYIQDEVPLEFSSDRHQIHHQMSAGLLQIIDEDTTLALVVLDPTRTTPGEERLIAGFQFTIAKKLTLMGDAGAQYTKSFSEKYLWRAGAQLNIFSDFFLRAGKFYDNVRKFKGTGWGVAWIGPRLGVEFAQKVSDYIDENAYIYEGETLVDTSVSAVIKF